MSILMQLTISLNYSQIRLRPRLPLCPQQISHQAPVSMATGAILEIRYSQSYGGIITTVYGIVQVSNSMVRWYQIKSFPLPA